MDIKIEKKPWYIRYKYYLSRRNFIYLSFDLCNHFRRVPASCVSMPKIYR